MIVPDRMRGLIAVHSGVNFEPRVLEPKLRDLSDRRVVLNDENSCLHVRVGRPKSSHVVAWRAATA